MRIFIQAAHGREYEVVIVRFKGKPRVVARKCQSKPEVMKLIDEELIDTTPEPEEKISHPLMKPPKPK